MRIGIRTLFHQLYSCKVQVTAFIKHFLISPTLYKGSTLINFGFLTKEDFRSVVSILDFRDLNVCITFTHIQHFVKFEPFLRIQLNLKTKLPRFYLHFEELFGSKLKIRGSWSENALFSKNTKFHYV